MQRSDIFGNQFKIIALAEEKNAADGSDGYRD